MDLTELYRSRLLASPKCLDYLVKRKIGLGTARRLEIGYFGVSNFSEYNDRLLFPVRNLYGEVVTYQGRAMFDFKAEGRAKYWHSSENATFKKSEVLYGLFQNGDLIVSQGFGVVSEGPTDVAAWCEAGIGSVATLGTAISDEHAFQMRQFSRVWYTAFDGDDAGRKVTERAQSLLKAWGIQTKALRMGEKDPADLLVTRGRKFLKELIP